MRYFQILNREMPWGDFGDILLSGMTEYKTSGKLKLKRTGPFVPPMVISGLSDLIVTDSIKTKLEASGLKGVKFSVVEKEKITVVDWRNWDLYADEPLFYPDNGEPENYILALPHSKETSESIGLLWELELEINGIFLDSYTYSPGSKETDFMYTDNSGWILVTENAKDWIIKNCGEFIEFNEITDLQT